MLLQNKLIISMQSVFFSVVFLTFLSTAILYSSPTIAATMGETPEIVYSGADAQELVDKAAELGSAVAIYEYVHNSIEFSPYHGSRSGSVNTFLGQLGSDVDIASTLIAMLRSQNIPARYAVANVRIPAAQVTNWLGIPNLDVAVQVLKDQGIQNVVLAEDRSTVAFEHVWTEALVPFDQYRGINTVSPAVDCSVSSNASRCTWVGLDGSFKQKQYNGLNLDPYNSISFDYTGYYNAIKNNDLAKRDKNPLTILEDQIGLWLRTQHPGKTLEDLMDSGEIIELHEGLLPASLPYEVLGSIRHYDTVALHDSATAIEKKVWDKKITVTNNICAPGAPPISMGSATISLVEVANKKLTSALESNADGTTVEQVWRLDGQKIGGGYINASSGSITYGCPDGFKTPRIGMSYWISVEMDGAPSVNSEVADRTIKADYSAIIGGYYLVATGGESSNWSQVHRAANQLISANDQYKIVFNPNEAGCLVDGTNCTPYVDIGGNGWDSSDTKLLETKPALDDLTGGMLYVAATNYYAKLREYIARSDRLMKTKTPIIGFLGVVSSVYEAEYIDGTAFSILPGGLLIDMKGITIGGSYRTNETSLNYSNRQFEFISHITSSLEHEIWQELTGFDAVSTVRGFQMSLANGATLLNPRKNASEDTLPSLYSGFGFTSTVPTGFTYAPFSISSTAPSSWNHATSNSRFDTFQASVDLSTTDTRRMLSTYVYLPNGGLYGWSKCVSDQIAQVNALPNNIYNGTTCSGRSFSGTKATIINTITNDWNTNIIPNFIGQTYFDYYDRNKGFQTTNRVYRALPQAIDAHDAIAIAGIRNDLYLRDHTQSWVEYLIPSKLVTGATYRFTVDIRKGYATSNNRLTSMSMEILNKSLSAGGGYIGLERLESATPAANAVDTIQSKGSDHE
jgi:hypothetical protein